MSRWLSVALFGTLLSGCVSTSGREWLNAPLEERASLANPEVVVAEASTDARPRLRRTVTLGETYASVPPQRASNGATAAPSVQVNVQTQVPIVVNRYGGYGYGYGYGQSSPPRGSARSSTSQNVGADWPAVPDYGPRPMR